MSISISFGYRSLGPFSTLVAHRILWNRKGESLQLKCTTKAIQILACKYLKDLMYNQGMQSYVDFKLTGLCSIVTCNPCAMLVDYAGSNGCNENGPSI